MYNIIFYNKIVDESFFISAEFSKFHREFCKNTLFLFESNALGFNIVQTSVYDLSYQF